MGLPGSGKTTLAKELNRLLINSSWFNADEVRKLNNDWDFSEEGRLRQAFRMADLSIQSNSPYVICDFVAPTKQIREIFDADITIWIDTIQTGRFADTNKIFEIPIDYDFRVTEQDCEKWAKIIIDKIVEALMP